MYMDLIVFGLIGLILSPSALGVSNKVQPFHSSGDGGLDIDTEGSGNPNKFETDDEDIVSEGSGTDGSGSGTFSKPVHETTTTPHTTRSLTPCEQLRLSVRNITGSSYVPKCTTSGEYEKLQCHKRMYNKECWCVDKYGNEVTGSKMMQPNVPDCVNGKGLKPCVYQLLKKKQGLLGTYHPRCTIDGEFEKIQCHGSACWCVDDKGVEILGSRTYKPEVPVCKEQTVTVKPEPKTTPKEIVIKWTDAPVSPVKTPKPDDNKHHHHHNKDKNINKYLTPDDKDEKKKIDIVLPKDIDTEDPTVVNRDDDDVDLSGVAQRKESSDFFANIVSRPGILAAVIGGAVVGLLCAILLVMFIVYRMRKKDEGSYPLEEQKFTNYSYMKAPDKEFYA